MSTPAKGSQGTTGKQNPPPPAAQGTQPPPPAAPPAAEEEKKTRARASVSVDRKLAMVVTGFAAIIEAIGKADSIKQVRDLLTDATAQVNAGKAFADEVGGKELKIIDERITVLSTELRALDFSKAADATKGAENMKELQKLQKRKAALQQLTLAD